MSGPGMGSYGNYGLNATRTALDMNWQPIETAPRDGTTIFGANHQRGQRGMVHYNSQGEWELVSGLTDFPMGVGFYPTHWMPLPELPSTSGQPS